MTCPQVRERLTEHALGLLANADRREIDRHLESCPGCRKESSQLSEGVATVGLALPPAEPPTSLEGRIVERLRILTGRAKVPSRRGPVRLLAAATLAGALLAASAFGWAIAERSRFQTQEAKLRAQIEANQDQIERFAQFHTIVAGVVPQTGAENFIATLTAARGVQGGGSLFMSSQKDTLDLLFVSVVFPSEAEGPYVVQLLNGHQAIRAGELQPPKFADGDWTLYLFTNYDLSEVLAVTVLDGTTGATVLTGAVRNYTGA